MAWKGEGHKQSGPWPGCGPFRHLPPWERPGWLYGKGACCQSFNSRALYPRGFSSPLVASRATFSTPEEEIANLEAYRKGIEEELQNLETRIQELKKVIKERKNTTG